MIFLYVLYVIVCIMLVVVVLVQRGRGSGLIESFAGVESIFGTKTSSMLTKATTIIATTFFIMCMIMSYISIRQTKSLVADVPQQAVQQDQPAKADDLKKALSAPMASAFRIVASESCIPTVITLIDSIIAGFFSFNSTARVSASSSHGFIIHCTPLVSNFVLFSTNLILVVVSGTLLKQINIFILNSFNLCRKNNQIVVQVKFDIEENN